MCSTAALRRIERRLEMLGVADGKAPDVKELKAKLTDRYNNQVLLNLRNMQDDSTVNKNLPLIKTKIGTKIAALFHDLKDSQNPHNDPKCVLLCSPGAYPCDCNQRDLENFCKCASDSVIQIDQVRFNGTSVFLTPADDDESAPELKVDTDRPYS